MKSSQSTSKSPLVQLSLFDDVPPQDNRPLPLIIADKWSFPLAHIEAETDVIYCARDWYIGLGGTKDNWKHLKSDWLYTLQPVMIEVKRPRRPVEQMEFVTALGLYSIAARMAVKNKPQLEEIKTYLAKAGVKLDEYRLDPESAFSDSIDVIESRYQKQGRTDSWIEVRVQGMITRKAFTAALRSAILDAPDNLYAAATDRLYTGLLDRTAAQLRGELNLSPKQNVRDGFGSLALAYTQIAELVSADRLSQHEIVPLSIALEIIYETAKIIGAQAQQAAALLAVDLLTGNARLLKP